MIEPGHGWAYLALFSEIGLILLVTTLAGILIGLAVDTQFRTVPLFILIGLFAGMGIGAKGVWTVIKRFLTRADDWK